MKDVGMQGVLKERAFCYLGAGRSPISFLFLARRALSRMTPCFILWPVFRIRGDRPEGDSPRAQPSATSEHIQQW